MISRREGEAPAEPQWLGRSLALPITNQFEALAISEKSPETAQYRWDQPMEST